MNIVSMNRTIALECSSSLFDAFSVEIETVKQGKIHYQFHDTKQVGIHYDIKTVLSTVVRCHKSIRDCISISRDYLR